MVLVRWDTALGAPTVRHVGLEDGGIAEGGTDSCAAPAWQIKRPEIHVNLERMVELPEDLVLPKLRELTGVDNPTAVVGTLLATALEEQTLGLDERDLSLQYVGVSEHSIFVEATMTGKTSRYVPWMGSYGRGG